MTKTHFSLYPNRKSRATVLVSTTYRAQLTMIEEAGLSRPDKSWSIVVHGGAGEVIDRKLAHDDESRAALVASIESAGKILERGGSSLDAVEAAVLILEDEPTFNAGKGSVFTEEGRHQLDASIMRGDTLDAGAVAGLTATKNPISVARAVMEKTRHVLLQGVGGDAFSKAQGFEQVAQDYFYTEYRWNQLQEKKKQLEKEYGTVGAVACDVHGSVAAATSTGGSSGQMPGRAGDSPVVGAGTYASNKSGAVSGTGQGEIFIRLAMARDICALVEYGGLSLSKAVDQMMESLEGFNGLGGVIAVAPDGAPAWKFNTNVMFRASMTSAGNKIIGIYEDDEPL